MRRGGVTAGAAFVAAGAVAYARRRREGLERVELVYDDGSEVTLDRPSPVRDRFLQVAGDAVRAVRR